MRQEPPLAARSRHVPNGVEHRPQIVLPLPTVLAAKQQIRQYKRPLLIRYIARITNSTLETHPSMLGSSTAHAKSLRWFKVPNSL